MNKNKIALLGLTVISVIGILTLACSDFTLTFNSNADPTKEEVPTQTEKTPPGQSEEKKPTNQPGGPTGGPPGQQTSEITPTGDLTLLEVTPNKIESGDITQVIVKGSGFTEETDLSFINGEGPPPTVEKVEVMDSETLLVTVEAKSGGPDKDRVFDLHASNPGGTTVTLEDAITLTN